MTTNAQSLKEVFFELFFTKKVKSPSKNHEDYNKLVKLFKSKTEANLL
jgi:hypothetical protein